jgi:hypothetical protein
VIEVLGWLTVADVVAAGLFAVVLYVIGKRSREPVSGGKAAALAGCLAVPAVLLYLAVWLWMG